MSHKSKIMHATCYVFVDFQFTRRSKQLLKPVITIVQTITLWFQFNSLSPRLMFFTPTPALTPAPSHVLLHYTLKITLH